ncbi:hypothetical protein A2U01_0073437, partial [Trifolium medium]|nr:hypothetical protein [Trifolium medium]
LALAIPLRFRLRQVASEQAFSCSFRSLNSHGRSTGHQDRP